MGSQWYYSVWNVSFNGQQPTCRPIQTKAHYLLGYFEARNQTTCTPSNQGDHLLFTCGDVQEMVVFSRESCLILEKKTKTPRETRTMVAFQECLEQAGPNLGLDNAVLYCTCVAPKIGTYTDAQLKKLPQSTLERFGAECRGAFASAEPPDAGSKEPFAVTSGKDVSAAADLLESAFRTACNTGVVASQRILPSHPDADVLLQRGYMSCSGALARWKREPGGLASVRNPVEFVCGYAVGAMFAKYGFSEEVQGKPSERALRAVERCVSEASKQGITTEAVAALQAKARAN